MKSQLITVFLVMDNLTSSLTISYWNANGIQSKTHDYFRFLIKNSVDVSLICETFLKPDIKFAHPDFKIYRLDRSERRKGGVAVVVHSNVAHSLLPSFDLQIIEAIGVEIVTSTGPISLISAYNPGGNRDNNSFLQDIQKLTKIRNSFFICGDLNARHRLWNCIRANTAGNMLFNELQSGSFVIHHPPSSTHIPTDPNRRPSTLDLVLSNGLHSISNLQTIQDLTSDHIPVRFEIDSTTISYSHPRSIPDYSRADWRGFKTFLDENIDLQQLDLSSVFETYQIDNYIDYFTTIIHQAHDRFIPRTVPDRFKLILPDDILLLIRLRNSRRRQWQRNRRDQYLRSVYNFTCNLVKKRIDEFRNKSWSANLLSMNNDQNNNKKLWKFCKILKNKHKSIPPLSKDGKLLITDKEKCEEIGKQFAEAHYTTFYDASPVDHEVNTSFESFFVTHRDPNFDPHYLVKPKEVSSFLKTLKNNKSPGFDQINNRCLKRLSRKALVLLTFIFNACIKLNYFPLAWRHAKVIAIPKPNKDHTSSKNYRPISLLSSLSKIFEKVLLKRLNHHIAENNIIPNTQFGFRSEHSTAHQLHRLTNNIKNHRTIKNSTGLVLLDNEKAFDTVWHKGLIFKMINLQFPVYLIKLIHSFLCDRNFVVTVGSESSQLHFIPAGVPQGSVLSPLLYNIYTHDIPDFAGCVRYQFADDVAISSSSKDPVEVTINLNASLVQYSNYCKKWKIKVNENKTEAVFFTRFRSPRKLPNRNLNFNGVDIPWKDEAKYLGLILDKKLTFQKHTQYILEKCEKLVRILYPFINRRSKLNTRNKILLYKTVFRSTLTYASIVWSECALSHRKKLQIFQNKCLKMIHNLPPWFCTEELHEMSHIETLDQYVNRMKTNYYQRCASSSFDMLRALCN